MLLIRPEDTADGNEGFCIHGLANSGWPTSTSCADKMKPNKDSSELILFMISDPEGTSDITRNEKIQIALYYDFSHSSSYPQLLEDPEFSDMLQKIEHAQEKSGKFKTSKNYKSPKTKGKLSKAKAGESEINQSNEMEATESAKSLHVKKVISWIHDSLKRPVMSEAFFLWCEKLHEAKYKHSKLDTMRLFLESHPIQWQTIVPTWYEAYDRSKGHLDGDHLMDVITQVFNVHGEVKNMYDTWVQTAESKTSRELWVLYEAVDLLGPPVLWSVKAQGLEDLADMTDFAEKALLLWDAERAKASLEATTAFVASDQCKTDNVSKFMNLLAEIESLRYKSSVSAFGFRVNAAQDLLSDCRDQFLEYKEHQLKEKQKMLQVWTRSKHFRDQVGPKTLITYQSLVDDYLNPESMKKLKELHDKLFSK